MIIRMNAGKNGFTLLEVLIATTILAIVLSVVYTSYSASMRSIELNSDKADIYHRARIILNRISMDLTGLFIPLGARNSSKNLTDNFIFLGEDREVDGYPYDSLTFTSAISKWITVSDKDSEETELSRISYYLSDDVKEDGASTLIRKQVNPYIKTDMDKKGEELGEDILGLDFKYIDTTGAVEDTWDSSHANTLLPRAVKVTIVIKSPKGWHKTFSTKILIPLTIRS